MRRSSLYVTLSLAVLLFAVSLTAALWEFRTNSPRDDWSKIVTTRDSGGEAVSYQMMVYVDRPIIRSDQTCEAYLRIRNTGKHPLELTSTYITNRDYVNGSLYGEAIGDWQIPGAPLRLLPGEIRDVHYRGAIRVKYPDQMSVIGSRGFQFCGFGLRTNTVTVYVLPGRPFWLILAAVAMIVTWGVRLRTRSVERREAS